MCDFERTVTGLFNHTIDSTARLTGPRLPATFVDTFRDLQASKIVQPRPTHLAEKSTSLCFGQQNARTLLANFLQNADNTFEVSDMEGR